MLSDKYNLETARVALGEFEHIADFFGSKVTIGLNQQASSLIESDLLHCQSCFIAAVVDIENKEKEFVKIHCHVETTYKLNASEKSHARKSKKLEEWILKSSWIYFCEFADNSISRMKLPPFKLPATPPKLAKKPRGR